jgi:hypothetical protein
MFDDASDDGEMPVLSESSKILDFLFGAAFSPDFVVSYEASSLPEALKAAEKYDMFLVQSRIEGCIL